MGPEISDRPGSICSRTIGNTSPTFCSRLMRRADRGVMTWWQPSSRRRSIVLNKFGAIQETGWLHQVSCYKGSGAGCIDVSCRQWGYFDRPNAPVVLRADENVFRFRQDATSVPLPCHPHEFDDVQLFSTAMKSPIGHWGRDEAPRGGDHVFIGVAQGLPLATIF